MSLYTIEEVLLKLRLGKACENYLKRARGGEVMGSDVLHKSPCCNSEDYSVVDNYMCCIKSHCEMDDFEQSVTASSKAKAIDKFLSTQALKRGWDKDSIAEHIYKESDEVGFECDHCGKFFTEPIEEVVNYEGE